MRGVLQADVAIGSRKTDFILEAGMNVRPGLRAEASRKSVAFFIFGSPVMLKRGYAQQVRSGRQERT